MKMAFNRMEAHLLSWLISRRWLVSHTRTYNSLDDRLQIIAIERLAMQRRIRQGRAA